MAFDFTGKLTRAVTPASALRFPRVSSQVADTVVCSSIRSGRLAEVCSGTWRGKLFLLSWTFDGEAVKKTVARILKSASGDVNVPNNCAGRVSTRSFCRGR